MNKTIPRSALFVFAALLFLLATAPAVVHADGGYWQQVVPTGDPPGPRYDSAGAWLDGSFYIFGGMVEESPGFPKNDMHMYDDTTNKWEEVSATNPPPSRYGHTMVEYNGKFYAVGGRDASGGHYNDNRVFDPATQSWAEKKSLGAGRAFHASAVYNKPGDGQIWILGGHVKYDGESYYSRGLYVYDIPNDRWRQKGGFLDFTPRIGHSMVVYNDNFYIYGGKEENGNPLNDFWKYAPATATGTWTRLTDPPFSGRFGHTAVVDGNKMRVIGGNDGTDDLQENWEYNFETATWTQKANVPVKLSESTAVIDEKDKIYVFGGKSDGVAKNALWLYIDAEKPKTPKTWAETSPARGNAPRSLEKGDPVNTAHGNYHFRSTLLDPGGPIPLHLSIFYDSAFIPFDGTTLFESPYWCINHHLFLNQSDNEALFEDGSSDGNVVAFIGTDGNGDGDYEDAEDSWRVCEDESVKFRFNQTPSSNYILDPIKEQVYIWNRSSGRLYRIVDRNGNYLEYTWKSSKRPLKVEDGLGRELNFHYTTTGGKDMLDYVNDSKGREIRFGYDVNLNLTGWQDALGQTTNFSYNTTTGTDRNSALEKTIHSKGNSPYEQAYQRLPGEFDNSGVYRVTNQTDAYGNTAEFTYDKSDDVDSDVTVRDPDGNETTYKHHPQFGHRVPTELSDAEGKSVRFGTGNEGEQDINRITSVTDRIGDTTNFSYHQPTGKIASVINNKGDITNFTYTAQNQTFTANPDEATFTFYDLARIDYPDGTHEEFTYDAKGNVLSYTDRAGKTWQYEYNSRGQVTRITNPTAGITDFTYNADATLNSSTNSDLGVTTYGYDTYKRLIRITRPDGEFAQLDYDLNDLITSITDERGKIYNYTYDANGNLVNATDPAGKETQYAHDLMDRVTQSTNRRDKTTQYAYDSMSRVASITDANGNANQLAYDARGWLNRITDPAGNVWQLGYDDEGLVSSVTTPLGYTTSFTRDKLGYITGITNPIGSSINFIRDEMSRITEAADALGRKTNYTFDARGFLTSVTRPAIGTATYTRNDLGLLTNIRDQNGKDWAFTYSGMGRLQNLTDPLNDQWQYAYNQRGFLDKTTYPTGETQDRSYDDAGNLVRRQYSDGTDLQFTYDDLNRLLTANEIEFSYSEVGRVVATTNPPDSFGTTYDDAGRRATATYADGLFTVSYQWNERDLLTSVNDSLTGTTIEFSYDEDGRVTGMTRSNAVNTTFTWDEATRLTRIQHDTVADLQYEYNAAGEVTKLDYTLPSDPADYLTAETEEFTFDDASQISSAGYAYDARGRQTATPTDTFTWDGAGRLIGTGSATLQYNGLGDLINRTEGGSATHYYYNYALGLNPVVAEKNEGTGDWQRFYVLAPTGQLLYIIDAANSNKVYFYHFDRGGNTLFLTDASSTVTDSYAYTPYGKLLHHEGTNEQPFSFGGAYQARQEGNNNLYQMRARYYDANTGRFVSREPLWPQIGSGKEINPYQYALDNPVMFMDRTGLQIAKNNLHMFEEGGDPLEEAADKWGIGFLYSRAGVEAAMDYGHAVLCRRSDVRELSMIRAAIFDFQNVIPQANGVMVTGDPQWLEMLEQDAQKLEQEIKAAEKEIKAAEKKLRRILGIKADGVNEFANLPELGLQTGRGVQWTPSGYQTPVEEHTGKRAAQEKVMELEKEITGKIGVFGKGRFSILFMKFKEEQEEVRVTLDWAQDDAKLNVYALKYPKR